MKYFDLTHAADLFGCLLQAHCQSWKDKTGAKQEKTEWHNLVFYRRLAEVVGEHLKKGALIYIEGKLTTEKYQKDGEDRYITKIVVSEMKMLGGNKVSDDHHVAEPAAKATARNGNNGAGKSAKQAGPEPF